MLPASDADDDGAGQGASQGCSVIVCTRNRPAFLRGGLEVLLPTLRERDDLLVVDSASDTDETKAVADGLGVRVIRADRRGVSRARNIGVPATSKSILVFTDDDCKPQPGWIDALEAAFDRPEIGFVLGRVRADVDQARLPFDRVAGPARDWVGPHDPNDLGVGACMAFRRQAWDSVGGCDERLGTGSRLRSADDDDIFYRLLQAGWIGRYEPDALVLHRDWRSQWDVTKHMWGVGLGTGAFVAKAARTAGFAEARPLVRRRLMTDGVLAVGRHVAKGWAKAAVVDSVKLVGTVVGLSVGAVLPLEGGHFRSLAN